MCVCVCFVCGAHFARQVVEKKECATEEVPMWSLMHCTEDSYKAMTGLDWPGDGDAKVYEKTFADMTKRKVISVTVGVPNCWQERVRGQSLWR